MKFLNDGGVSIEPPKKLKKITGTRFGAILDVNPWSTPFKMWCEITKTYEDPYEETIYTMAGKTIEPKQIEYMKMFNPDIKSPIDIYGENYFDLTHGDFFPKNKIFGGMWDAISSDTVYEFKTTKRIEDWENGIPEYYALQAALYAELLGYDKVTMVCSILTDDDYVNPNGYNVSANNTITRSFKVSEKYPDMKTKMSYCTDWYKDKCLTGFSPVPTEDDAKIIKVLKTVYIDDDDELDNLMLELEELKENIDIVENRISAQKKRYKALSDRIKEKLLENIKSGETAKFEGSTYVLTVTPTSSVKILKNKLVEDGIFDKYSEIETIYKMTIKEK